MGSRITALDRDPDLGGEAVCPLVTRDPQKVRQAEPWGVKVATVEIKDVEIPEAMQRALARAAEAEREPRTKITAEGEYQASQRLFEASEVLSRNPAAMQLRYQQTLVELACDKSTIVFPLTLELIAPFLTQANPAPTPGPTASPLPRIDMEQP